MTLAARDLSVDLGAERVLAGVACTLEPGRITGIIGPNGAGKSTLLRALAGLVTPAAGTITLAGKRLAAFDRFERARAIAFLPQDRTVHWPLTVRAVVALGRIPHRAAPAGDSAADQAAIDAAMTDMDVAHLADRPVDTLSGGERARVLCARALAQRGQTILADEPTAGLDPAHALELFAMLARLAANGRTIGVALHDLSLAARFCHDVVILARGRVVAAGSCAEVMTSERLSATFGVRMAVGSLDGLPIVLPVGSLAK